MKLPATQALYAYWLSQCGDRCAPDRNDIDPAALRGVLPHTFMIAVDGPASLWPVRVSGTRLDALFGRDLKGAAFADLCRAADRTAIGTVFADVLDAVQPALVGLSGAPAGYDPERFELLVLPLRHNGRTHARLLCGLFAARTPSWLGLRAATGLSLSSWRMLDRQTEAVRAGDATALRRAHLVVYPGGRDTPVQSAASLQSHVKAPLAHSRDRLLSTRGS